MQIKSDFMIICFEVFLNHSFLLYLSPFFFFFLLLVCLCIYLSRELGFPLQFSSLHFAGGIPMVGLNKLLCALQFCRLDVRFEVQSDSGLLFDLCRFGRGTQGELAVVEQASVMGPLWVAHT